MLSFLPLLAFSAPREDGKSGNFSRLMLDTLDQKIDMSQFMRRKYGFMVVPTLVTEPAIGYGGGGGLIFIHRTPEEIARGGGKFPSMTAIGGIYTESHTWAVGGGHFGFTDDGSIRYRIAGGYASVNLNYYRTPVLPGGIERIGFNLVVYGGLAQLTFRIKKSDFYLGASYSYGHSETTFDRPVDLPEIDPREYSQNIGGAGAVLIYDTRDNMFTPNEGMIAYLEMVYNAPALGSTNTFQRLYSHWLGYLKLTNHLFGTLRLDYQTSSDGTPFYMRPFIYLRGVPAMRYQGEATWLAETEVRWDPVYRWSLVGFGGYGETFLVNDQVTKRQKAYNFGMGFRYLIARLYGIRAGIDVARGPEDWAFYIQFGSSWFRY